MYPAPAALSITDDSLSMPRRPATIAPMAETAPDLSIVVPAYREAANLRPLTERIFAALEQADMRGELIIVDDNSRDGSAEIVAELSATYPVRIVVRTHERGLSSAVLRGFAEATGECFVVMDADLQHPPEKVPEVARRLDEGDCDFVIGTRYAGSGGIGEDWPWYRRLASRSASLMARPLTPLSDPMSGFFAIRRETWAKARKLDPIGYKIALELYVKGGCRSHGEVPIHFAARTEGESKLTGKVLIHYVKHLIKLYWFRFPIIFVMCIVVGVAAVAWLASVWIRS